MRRLAGRLAVVLLGLLAALAVPGPAAAHVGGEEAGSDFDGRILSVTPDVPGLTVRILQFGDGLELVNDTSTEVLVPGYSDEPYLRIGPDGVWRNANSPAAYLVTFGIGLVLGGIAAVRRFRESGALRDGAGTPTPAPVG